ncbi:5037_t:CDS:2, partial [Ambispora leptoticha]
MEYQTASHDEYRDIFNDSVKIILNEDLTEELVNSENLAEEMRDAQQNLKEQDIATYTMDQDYKPPVELNKKDEIQEISQEEFKPKEAKQKKEEFNFDKIERTEIEQIKKNIINLQKLANEQAKHIQILKQAIKIHQLMFNELHQENTNLKR